MLMDGYQDSARLVVVVGMAASFWPTGLKDAHDARAGANDAHDACLILVVEMVRVLSWFLEWLPAPRPTGLKDAHDAQAGANDAHDARRVVGMAASFLAKG